MSISKINVNGTEYQLCHNASSSVAGIAKLYNTFGSNEDGAITQKALSDFAESLVTKEMYWDHSDDFYGIQWTDSNTNPVRIGNEALHRTLPILSKMRRCLVADDGTVTDCTSTSFVFPNDNYQWMVEIPEYWFMATTESIDGETVKKIKLYDHEVPGAKHSKKVYVGVTEAMSNYGYIKNASNILTYKPNPSGTGYILADGNGKPLVKYINSSYNYITYDPTTNTVGEGSAITYDSTKHTLVTFTEETHDAVNIGGLYWATCNVGASTPDEKGLYFQWGDTQGYSVSQIGSGTGQKSFDWSTYKYCDNGDSQTMTKYNSTDNLTVLDYSDDAVRAAWGGSWRMPTSEEVAALISATDITYGDYINTSGIFCIDKTDNTKFVFLPSAGYYAGTTANNTEGGFYGEGDYWTSNVSDHNAWNAAFHLYSYRDEVNTTNATERRLGHTVRGVSSTAPTPLITISFGNASYKFQSSISTVTDTYVTNKSYKVSQYDDTMLVPRLYSGSTYTYLTLSNSSYNVADFIVDENSSDGSSQILNHAEWFRGGNVNDSGSDQNDTLNKSQLGRPSTYLTRANFRTMAKKRGAGWSQQYWDAYMAWVRLYVVEYASFNSQATYNANRNVNGFMQGGLGAGVTNANDSKWSAFNSYNPLIPCGVTRSLLDSTGVVSVSYPANTLNTAATTLSVPSYRGIENPFGHIWKLTDGVNVYADSTTRTSTIYICDDPDKFADDTSTNYTRIITGAPYNKNGYIKTWWWDENGDFIPTSIGGSASSYLYDYSYLGSSGWRVLRSGGHAPYGAASGLFYFAAAGASSAVYASVGSRLYYTPNKTYNLYDTYKVASIKLYVDVDGHIKTSDGKILVVNPAPQVAYRLKSTNGTSITVEDSSITHNTSSLISVDNATFERDGYTFTKTGSYAWTVSPALLMASA